MGRDDWYRHEEWSPEIADEFWARLKRSRSDWNKAQYLRIQAHYLERAGRSEAVLELIDYMMDHHPEPSELASAELSRASALARLGRDSEAVSAFRRALQAEAAFPNVRTDAALDFAEFAVVRGADDLYDEVEEAVTAFVQTAPVLLPVQRFKILAAGAIIEQRRGNTSKASQLATNALTVAEETHSGFRYHPKFGLVGEHQTGLLERLAEIAKLGAAAGNLSGFDSGGQLVR